MKTEKMMQSFLEKKEEWDDQEASAACVSDYYATFMAIKMESLKFKQNTSASEGLTSENLTKNRYKDVIPYDESRVKLELTEGSTDYINASYINGVTRDKEYIAAMGPLASTADDFWQMIWQEKICLVITACNEFEGVPRKKKCHRYWCQDLAEAMEFGDMSVKLVDENEANEDFIVRRMKVLRQGEERHITQLHYLSWPDRSVPSSVDSILSLIRIMREKQGGRSSPILVHCSAGCGRTGTIIAVDYVWNMIRFAKLQDDFNLKSLILEMRQQRPAFVQAAEQYRFLHDSVAELFRQHLTKVKGHLYENFAAKSENDYITAGALYSDNEEDETYQEASSTESAPNPPEIPDEYSVALRLQDEPESSIYALPHKALSNVRIKVIPKRPPPSSSPSPPVPSPLYRDAESDYAEISLPDEAYSYASADRSCGESVYEDISAVSRAPPRSSPPESSISSSSLSPKQNTFLSDLPEKSMGSNVGRQLNAFVKKFKTIKPNSSLTVSSDAIEEIYFKGRNISFGHRVEKVGGPRIFVPSYIPQ